tara:strand:+ start:998 stop:1201 length:204 start_codon:yes stop_codon:yes gene_type:complete
MSKLKTEIRDLQKEHKKLDQQTTDLERDRQADRSTSSKYNLRGLKKAKLAIKDKINSLRYKQEDGSK